METDTRNEEYSSRIAKLQEDYLIPLKEDVSDWINRVLGNFSLIINCMQSFLILLLTTKVGEVRLPWTTTAKLFFIHFADLTLGSSFTQ